ncbi:MAG: hypothetical protein LBF60_07650 [Treponema sp.]|nr:hypothetical protein [Treponema sp.]
MFVHTAVYEQFLKQLSSATENLRPGDRRAGIYPRKQRLEL